MSRFVNLLVTMVSVATISACSSENAPTERAKIGGLSYDMPSDEESLPKIELLPLENSLSLASCSAGDRGCITAENQKLWDTLLKAGAKIQEGAYSSNNVYAAGITWSNRNGRTVSRCVKVQVQHRLNGKAVVDETFVPEGQGPECTADSVEGLTVATMGIFAKVYGNNYAAGLGIGAVLYVKPYIAGCAAGAAGYASEYYGTSDGTAGAFCTAIYDTVTGATL